MSHYIIQPIEYIDINNFKEVTAFDVPHGATASLYFVLKKVSALSTNRYIPPSGAVLKLDFLRARAVGVGSLSVNTSKTAAVVSTDDKSMYKVDLTVTDTQNIISGSVTVTLTVAGVATVFSMPYLVKKLIAAPGH